MTKYDFTDRDIADHRLSVEGTYDGAISLAVFSGGEFEVEIWLTPKKVRKLRKALKEIAVELDRGAA